MSYPLAVMRSWVALVTGLEVIYDGDDEPTAPRPNVDASTLSYAALNFEEDSSPMSTAFERMTETAGTVDPTKFVQHRSLLRRGLLDVALYGPGADDYCRALNLSMARPDVMLLLDTAGDYAINRPSAVNDEPIIRASTREPSASIQFMIEWVDSETYELEAVETIDTTVNVDP